MTHQTAWNTVQMIVALPVDVPACDEQEDLSVLVEDKIRLIDGLLIPTFHWRHRKDLPNGKHRRYGVNIQLFVDVHGRIIGASQAFPGSWHDMHCFRAAGWSDLVAHSSGGTADLSYQGAAELVVPVKKPAGGTLAKSDRHLNTCPAKIRVPGEWGVAHLEELADPYIQAVVGLQKLNEAHAEHRPTFDRIRKTRIVRIIQKSLVGTSPTHVCASRGAVSDLDSGVLNNPQCLDDSRVFWRGTRLRRCAVASGKGTFP